MRKLFVVLSLIGIAYGQTWVRTGSGKVKLGGATLQGDSLVISASATVDSSIYASKSWTTNQFVAKGTGGSVDTTTLFAGKLGGWVEVQRTADTTLNAANVTFVNLGDPMFTMTASGVYEIQGRLFMTRATAANGVTVAANFGGATSVGLVFSAPDGTDNGTDLIKTGHITTITDSLQLTGTAATGQHIFDIDGTVVCDGSNRWFGLRWHLEIASSAVVIKRGSYIRYRKLY